MHQIHDCGDSFDPANQYELLYNYFANQPLADLTAELECLNALKEYIDWLENYVVTLHKNYPPYNVDENTLRDMYEDSKNP